MPQRRTANIAEKSQPREDFPSASFHFSAQSASADSDVTKQPRNIDVEAPIEASSTDDFPPNAVFDLFNSWPTNEGENYKSLLIEQYKLYATHMEKELDRENSRNSVFLSTNAALVAAAGIAIANLSLTDQLLPLFVIFTMAAAINTSWAALISQSRRSSRLRKFTLALYEIILPTRPFWFDLQGAHSESNDRVFRYAHFPIIYIAMICTAIAWAVIGAQSIILLLNQLLLPMLWRIEEEGLIYQLDRSATTAWSYAIMIFVFVLLIKVNRHGNLLWRLSWAPIYEVRKDMTAR